MEFQSTVYVFGCPWAKSQNCVFVKKKHLSCSCFNIATFSNFELDFIQKLPTQWFFFGLWPVIWHENVARCYCVHSGLPYSQGHVQCWDPRSRSRVGQVDVATNELGIERCAVSKRRAISYFCLIMYFCWKYLSLSARLLVDWAIRCTITCMLA